MQTLCKKESQEINQDCKNEVLKFCFIKMAIKCSFHIHIDICGIEEECWAKTLMILLEIGCSFEYI